MKRFQATFNRITLLLAGFLLVSCAAPTPANRVVRVAVIGGMMRTGLWPELAAQYETQTGHHAQLAMSGNRDRLAEAVRAGKVDVVAMQAGESASGLVAEGYCRNMRAWARNEFVIIGPHSDPAGIRGLRDGAAALARIARVRAPYLDYQNSGPRDVANALWEKAGIRPEGNWLLADDSSSSEEALEFARKKQAYVILGRIPVPQGANALGGLEILVQGDPEMHRVFVVLEAMPQKFPQANHKGAHAFANFLVRRDTQNFLLTFATNTPAGLPLFYPVTRR
jgi:tungstate transport system substrate-binding protein